jgi:hypothetical protein
VAYSHSNIVTKALIECVECKSGISTSNAETSFNESKGRGSGRTSVNALPVLFTLSQMASGDGGTEAQRVLGFLDLPGGPETMEKTTFPTVEKQITLPIRAACDKALYDMLVEEVRLTLHDDSDHFNRWIHSVTEGGDLCESEYPQIFVSMDMGWNKRSSGRRYDSLSGHCCLVGQRTRRPILKAVKSKFCRYCSAHARKQEESEQEVIVGNHVCPHNHDGSSGSMESLALVDMIKELWFKYHVAVDRIVTDDDSSMAANCRRSSEQNDKGMLPHPIKEPMFVADPAHRKKTLRNKLYKLLSQKKDDRLDLSAMDIVRLCKNFIYYIRSSTNMDEDERVRKAAVIYEHHFDCHDYCGNFCRRKLELETGDDEQSEKFYRCKVRNKELYVRIKSIIDEYITKDRLAELTHGKDTNVNECLNQVIAWFAPKNKTYGGSYSLENRVSIAVGVFNKGYLAFFSNLLERLGIQPTEGQLAYFRSQDKDRNRRRQLQTTAEHKKKRQKTVYEKLRQHTENAKKALARAEKAEYRAGVAVEPIQDTVRPCKCGSITHKTRRHRLCPMNPQRLATTIEHGEDVDQNTEEQSLFDSLPLASGRSQEIDALAVETITEEFDLDTNEVNDS